MDRRPLALVLAFGLIGALPSGALAASPDALFAAASQTGTLTDQPSADLVAQASGGTLSSKPKATGTTSSSSTKSSGSSATKATTATSLPYTGSDPRITLLLGMAAILLGAGLRMRTGDARDY
ncbi:MAG: hypothetical protein AAGC46_01110 [Solirubrobacteraceae bacterium]|nr:hypothetical protein [Patulibacter sp.]